MPKRRQAFPDTEPSSAVPSAARWTESSRGGQTSQKVSGISGKEDRPPAICVLSRADNARRLTALTGATLAELMGRLGHSSPAAAMRYQHVAAGRDQAIAEALSRIAAGGS